MTPKEKANQLVSNFKRVEVPEGWDSISENSAIECSKIAVDEIIASLKLQYEEMDYGQGVRTYLHDTEMFWQEVKNELEKL